MRSDVNCRAFHAASCDAFCFFNTTYLGIENWYTKCEYSNLYVLYWKPRVPSIKQMIDYNKAQDLEVWNFAHNPKYVWAL